MLAQSADHRLQQHSGPFAGLGRNLSHLFRLLTGYYLRDHSSRLLWRERPDIRQKILLSIVILWAELWILSAAAIFYFWDYNFLLPFTSLALLMAFGVGFYVLMGRNRAGAIIAGYTTAMLLFWLIMMNIPLFVLDDPENLPPLLASLVDSPLTAPSYVIWGWAWIGFIYVILLFMPIWKIKIKHGEIYLVQDEGNYPEDFRLDSRPGPRVDKEVIDVLVSGGIPRDLIDSFVRFNGPAYMRKVLANKLAPHADVVTRRMLQLLFDQAADQSQKSITPILWVSAMDNVRLIWDRKRTVTSTLVIDQLVTKDGHPVEIELRFTYSFDPEAIRKPEFRHSLSRIVSRKQMVAVLSEVMEAAAISEARLYFIHLPLRAALTQGSVEDFRRDFPQRMAPLQALGLLIQPEMTQCRPLIAPEVQRAEIEMLASRAHALADTARLQALIEKVMLHGVPAELLGGLLMLDPHAASEPNRVYQLQANADLMALPEASPQQQARFIYQKFRGDMPGDAIPQLPAAPLPDDEDSGEWAVNDRFDTSLPNSGTKTDS